MQVEEISLAWKETKANLLRKEKSVEEANKKIESLLGQVNALEAEVASKAEQSTVKPVVVSAVNNGATSTTGLSKQDLIAKQQQLQKQKNAAAQRAFLLRKKLEEAKRKKAAASSLGATSTKANGGAT